MGTDQALARAARGEADVGLAPALEKKYVADADFRVSADVQKVIKTFGVDKYGRALFVAVAGAKEDDI